MAENLYPAKLTHSFLRTMDERLGHLKTQKNLWVRDINEARHRREHIPCFQGTQKIKKTLDSRLVIGSGCHPPNTVNGFWVEESGEVSNTKISKISETESKAKNRSQYI